MILATVGIISFPFAASQIVGGNAYLIGDYIEIGVDTNGYEGTDDLPGSNSRGGICTNAFLGYVANPQMDGWVNYDGDFFTPGSTENGFGLDIAGLELANNASGCATPVSEIPGSITDYWETADSVKVTWQGNSSGIDVVVIYGLQKNELHYTTTVMLENATASAITDVYYYRNVDPDNNETIGWGYPTSNTIVSQMAGPGDSAVVEASQVNIWTSTIALEAFGDTMWRSSYGGFTNRDGSEIWNGTGFTITEGSTATGDVAISLARKIDELPVGKSTPVTFSYRVRFGDGTWDPPSPVDSTGGTDPVVDFQETSLIVYPNPNKGEFSIDCEGDFYFMVSDQSGRLVADGLALDNVAVDLSAEQAGIYFVKVRQDRKFRVVPIVLE